MAGVEKSKFFGLPTKMKSSSSYYSRHHHTMGSVTPGGSQKLEYGTYAELLIRLKMATYLPFYLHLPRNGYVTAT